MVRAVDSAASAIAAHFARFERAASRVASGEGDMVGAIVAMQAAEIAVAANVKVIRSAHDLERSLLHVIA